MFPTVSDLLATPKRCPTIYSAPTLLFPTYCIAASYRAIASACKTTVSDVFDWNTSTYIGLILPHVLDCFRLIGNTETMSDYIFRTHITVSDVLHSHDYVGMLH